ncbi:MAG TPA: serine/threonine-protein kinase [Thermoanaerobaculia bacterium]|nr:serine/threonine-protein kinase [Thermoanaerobaculia bacterium]
MLCSLCGRENREGAKFCDGCGGALDRTVTRTGIDPELDAVRKAFHDRFAVESLLGRGGMGNVYKARERTLDRYVALKIVPEFRSQDEQFIERFRREARIAARLRHPRIVSVHEVGMMGTFPYFSMDYIEGSTLRSVVERRRSLPHEDAISIVVEICRAVSHAHSKGIIHRDLKPENVMIDTEGDVFVMDFGLARAIEDVSLTQPGTVIGTPFYMSPEQLAGEKLDERSDVYSIGLILYYCLTGDDLFRAEGVTAVMAKHSTIRIRDVVATQSILPANLQELLVSMIEEDRNMRARSVKEVLERLTLRKIVALGLAATEEQPQIQEDTPTAFKPPDKSEEESPRGEDPRLTAAAERRKARLRSLLDSL